jgi:hypothetical protein
MMQARCRKREAEKREKGEKECFSSSALRSWLARSTRALVIIRVRLYQMTLGHMLPDSCRFKPTCSNYMIEAVRKHGLLRGAWLGIRRVLRCHPFNPGGYDPVP